MSCVKLMHEVMNKNFELYQKAHVYHWNVEGINFNDLHAYFGGLYTEVFGQMDILAEQIRALGARVEFAGLSVQVLKTTDGKEMVGDLIAANDAVITALNAAFVDATKDNKQGLLNYLADRLDVHAKHAWQLKAINGTATAKQKPTYECVTINGVDVFKSAGTYIGAVVGDKEYILDEGVDTFATLIEEIEAKYVSTN